MAEDFGGDVGGLAQAGEVNALGSFPFAQKIEDDFAVFAGGGVGGNEAIDCGGDFGGGAFGRGGFFFLRMKMTTAGMFVGRRSVTEISMSELVGIILGGH